MSFLTTRGVGIGGMRIESILAIGAYQRAGGKTVTITTTVADLTGRPPRTVAEFVQENASASRDNGLTTC